MKKNTNPFFLIPLNPWPINLSIAILASALMFLKSLSENKMNMLSIMLSVILISINSFNWWNDLKKEASFKGHFSMVTMKLLKFSMIMFIISEIMFFFSFFWMFFHNSMTPNIELGMMWPPKGISPFNPMGMPLLNSLILISSGASITWSHNSMNLKKLNDATLSMSLTIILGLIFTFFQMMEYKNAQFSLSDSSYGSTFFLMTGFHGIHVLIGTVFLIKTIMSMMFLQNSNYHFISFELSAWYWHFVDVVWLFLFMSIYWWGS